MSYWGLYYSTEGLLKLQYMCNANIGNHDATEMGTEEAGMILNDRRRTNKPTSQPVTGAFADFKRIITYLPCLCGGGAFKLHDMLRS